MEEVDSSHMLVAAYHNSLPYFALNFDYFVTRTAKTHEIKLSKTSFTVRRTFSGQPYGRRIMCVQQLLPRVYRGSIVLMFRN